MKKFSAMFLCLVFVVFALSGCGANGGVNEDKIDGTVPTPLKSDAASANETQQPALDYPSLITLKSAVNSGFNFGNIMNGGLVAEDEGYIFYRSPIDKKLYRSLQDGSDKILISDYPFNQAGNTLFSINAVDGWVYFLQEPAQGIFKVKYDGTEKTKLVDEYCDFLQVADGYMYFINIDDKRIYKATTDGSEVEILVNEGVGEFSLVNGWIYFTEEYYQDSRLFRVSTDGASKDLIFGERCYSINIDGDRVYVIKSEDNSVWSMKSNGSDAKLLDEVIAKNMNIADGWIYYVNYLDGEKLYKVKTDGSSITKVSDLKAEFMFLTDDWIYFGSNRISRDGGEAEAVE